MRPRLYFRFRVLRGPLCWAPYVQCITVHHAPFDASVGASRRRCARYVALALADGVCAPAGPREANGEHWGACGHSCEAPWRSRETKVTRPAAREQIVRVLLALWQGGRVKAVAVRRGTSTSTAVTALEVGGLSPTLDARLVARDGWGAPRWRCVLHGVSAESITI